MDDIRRQPAASTRDILLALPQTSRPFSAPHTPETLILLLARVADGDRDAFAQLYQATSLKLFGVVLRILKRKSAAEDILQETYIKIWEKAGDFKASRGSPITWMVAIARHRALDEVRRGPQLVSSEDVPEFENIASADLLALEQMERSQDYKKLAGCLNGIEAEKRQMILLAYHDGVSRDVLAQRFAQPVATIKTWLRRSLQSLKECLGA